MSKTGPKWIYDICQITTQANSGKSKAWPWDQPVRIVRRARVHKEVHMPGRDHTGPEGKGSRTGRGLGNCGTAARSNEDMVQDREQGMDQPQTMGLGLAPSLWPAARLVHGQRPRPGARQGPRAGPGLWHGPQPWADRVRATAWARGVAWARAGAAVWPAPATRRGLRSRTKRRLPRLQ